MIITVMFVHSVNGCMRRAHQCVQCYHCNHMFRGKNPCLQPPDQSYIFYLTLKNVNPCKKQKKGGGGRKKTPTYHILFSFNQKQRIGREGGRGLWQSLSWYDLWCWLGYKYHFLVTEERMMTACCRWTAWESRLTRSCSWCCTAIGRCLTASATPLTQPASSRSGRWRDNSDCMSSWQKWGN